MTAKRFYEAMVWVLKGIAALWRNLKPQLELGVLAIQIFLLDICEAYQRTIDKLYPRVEKKLFMGWPKTSRLFTHIFFGTGVIGGTILVISGIKFVVKVHIPWILSLNVEQVNAWTKLNCVFLVCVIVIGSSIIKRGIIRTILRAVGIIFGIKCLTVLFAWTLTLKFGIDTPVLDNLITAIAKGPDVIIIQFTQKFIPWLMDNIHIVCG